MCGIAGWYRRRSRPVQRDVVARQCERLIHRGPDDHGYLIDGDFGFGMRRLSIIDVERGQQPITSADGRYTIICNGEIVNHLELRRELEPHFRFETRSDVETLLASFVRWGDDAWLRLEGMYAAAIWDHHSKTLTLARDPLGIKPLFFSQQLGGIAFASEISALRVIPGFAFDVDNAGLRDFFRFGHVLGPRTIYRQVRALEPGHVMTVGVLGSATRRFWQPHIAPRSGLTQAQWIEETRERTLTTVRQHMLSDVPVGVFLSGGLDSAAIAANMAKASSGALKAFTVGFPGSKIDETAAAAEVASHLGFEHIVLPIEPETAADVLPAVQRSFDEPTAANSAIPLWYLSRAAAEHVKVVLCGEGGDELFIGYNRQRWAQRMSRCSPAVRALGGLDFVGRIPELPGRKLNYLRGYADQFRRGALLSSGFERFFAAVSITSGGVRERIYTPDFARRWDHPASVERLSQDHFEAAQPGLTDLEQFMLGDLTVHLQASLLQRLDRASMAHSLEARVPFLSHRFVDWALSIPTDLKLRNGVGKYILRRAIAPMVPPAALQRRKLGFQMPLADWCVGGFNDFARDAWRSSGLMDAGFLDARGVEQLFDEHRKGTTNHGRLLYAIAMLSCWWSDQRVHVARARPRPLQLRSA
jgi:asparagine synthase (glutamine-hydrolysing)